MALGGGTFLAQNKTLPGTYHNFISAARAWVNLSERGYAALPIPLDWGEDGNVFTVTMEDLQKKSRKIFGYDYTHEKLRGIRDLFKNIHTAYFYKLATNAVAASNEMATAKCKGIRGNALTVVVSANVDEDSKFDVLTYLGTSLVDEQTVGANTGELKDSDYIVWKPSVEITETAGMPLVGGANGDATNGQAHQEALEALEPYSFNAIGCLSTEDAVKSLYSEFTKRLRDQVGVKFQLVLHKKNDADHEGIISVKNDVTDSDVASAVYWTLGAAAGCPVNKSNTNKQYDGEFAIDTKFSQPELEEAIRSGEYAFHKVGEDVHVLEDLNTFTSFTVDKNEDFSSNQTMRVLDQIGNDTAILFNKRYLGKVQNDKSGRVSFWGDLVAHRKELQKIRALEDFEADDVVVEKGESKKSVAVAEAVQPTNCMTQLYITTTVV
ncbi:phage tail sheath family protein [Sporosarcina sp. FSL K6-1508]|uniref:phage tail sheath family protein n=1 Tax=Sporosarcina sp. FSL K6-1508 TaxID=2921553 RepID=UPI0030F4DB3B